MTITFLQPSHRIDPRLAMVRKPAKVTEGLFVQNIPEYPQLGGRSSAKNDAEAQPRNPAMTLERGPTARKGPI